jgi:hypothetical protein
LVRRCLSVGYFLIHLFNPADDASDAALDAALEKEMAAMAGSPKHKKHKKHKSLFKKMTALFK